MPGTLASTKHLGVICAVSGNAPLDQSEWMSWLELMRAEADGEVPVLFYCGDGAPNARQRRELFDLTEGRAFRFAVMTDSKQALMSMSAFEWMGDIHIGGFSLDNFDAALEYLDVSQNFVLGIERKIHAMVETLGEGETAVDESAIQLKEGVQAPPRLHVVGDDDK